MPRKKKKKDIILHAGVLGPGVSQSLRDFCDDKTHGYRLMLLYDGKKEAQKAAKITEYFDIAVPCNFDSPRSITQALHPYEDELLAITCRAENRIPTFQKVIPHVPYLRTPTTESLEWATSKLHMRRRLSAYDKKIAPNYTVATDATKKTIDQIEEKIGYPLVIKPAGLAQSILVSICFHREEFESSLRRTLRKIKTSYKESEGRGEPQVIVEQFMEGTMYSIDSYVSSRGKIYHCPPVHIKTGREIGFDDFFGYQQITPTLLSKESIKAAEAATEKGIHALGLRSTTTHTELMKTEAGWKVVEVGPRIGGFRDIMYKLSYGIDHTENDIYIRIPKKPIIRRTKKGYTAALKFFSRKEGTIANLTGTKKIQELGSFVSLTMNKKVNDRATFAKHGGKSVFNVILFNEERSKLLADIRRLEQTVKIEIK